MAQPEGLRSFAKPPQDSRCCCRDSIGGPAKYKYARYRVVSQFVELVKNTVE
jgi:hypothetical protein